MRVGKSTLIHFISQVGLSVAGFVATFVIARILGAETLGTYSVTVAMIFWLNIPAMAVSSAIKKRISEGYNPGKFLSAGFIINGTVALVISASMIFAEESVNEYVGVPVSTILAIMIFAEILFSTSVSSLNGQKKVATGGIIQVFEQILRTVAQVSLIFLGWKLTGLLLSHTVSLAIAAVLCIILFEIRPSIPSRTQFRSLLKYSRYSWLGTLKSRSFGWMDTIVLAFFVSSSLIGIYEVAWRLASMLALVSLSVQQTLFPEFSELQVEDNTDRIHHYLNEGLVFTGIFCIPGFVGAAALGGRLLKIYRPQFAEGALILLILVFARTISAYGSQFLSAINAIDRPDIAFKINLIFVITNVILNIFLISNYGWFGAAFATTFSAIVTLLLGYYGLSQLIGSPNIPVREILRQIFAACVMGTIVFGIVNHVPRGNYLTIAIVIGGAAIYTVVLIAISKRVRGKVVSLTPF